MADVKETSQEADSPSGEEALPAGYAPPVEPPKAPRMTTVFNSHRFRSFHLGGGKKIGPGQTGRIPTAMFKKVGDTCPWLKRAGRGDVI